MFEIVPQPDIRIINPAPGDFWKVGTTNTIRWSKGGSMHNAFVLYYSTDPYAVTNELLRGAFDFADGVYSYRWVGIPFQLGQTRIIITNQMDVLVGDEFNDFSIAARFDIEPFSVALYALEQHGVRWVTRGDVESVDLYYSLDLDRAPGSWKLINTEGPYSENIGHNQPATDYPWTLPNARADTVWLRIQDHDYPTERFDASVPGPYDDLGPFPIFYYTVVWEVYDGVTSEHLDHLSVSDTSGWAASDLASPIVREYPYGTWSTVWFREYFSDKVVFNWESDGNKTNVVTMERSEMEPDYKVLADFTYNPPTTNFNVQAWIERGGQILENAEECKVYIFNSDGDLIETVAQTDAKEGVFWLSWDVDATAQRHGETYTEADVFFARVEIKFSGVVYSSGLTSTLRVPASGVSLSNIEAATATLLAEAATIRAAVGTVSNSFGVLTNAILPAMEEVTNSISTLMPTMTNMTAAVSNVSEIASGALSRILTRPTQVVDGKPITVLYKTRRNYSRNEVNIAVTPAGHTGKMTEVTPGLGIYEHEMLVNWGKGSYTITCSDPMATDSMIIEVVDQASLSMVPNMLVDISNRLDEVFGELTNVTGVVGQIENFGPIVEAMSNDLRKMTYTITNEIGQISELKGLLEGIDKLTNSLAKFDAGSIENLDRQITDLTNALSGVDWQDVRDLQGDMSIVTQAMEGLANIPTIAGEITNLTDAISGISDVTNITYKLDLVTNRLFGVAWDDVTQIREDIIRVTNNLAGADFGEIGRILGDVTNSIGEMKWEHILQLMDDMAVTTNTLEDLKTLADISSELGDLTNAINELGAVTNLGPQISDLTNALGDIDWRDIAKIQEDVIAATNALGALTGLDDVQSDLAQLADVPTRLNALSNMLENTAAGIGALGDIADQVDTLTNVVPALDTLSGSLGQVDLPGISSGVKAITNTLQGFDWGTVEGDAVLSQDIWEMLDAKLGKITDSPEVSTFFGRLNQLAQQLGALGGTTEEASKNAKMAKTKATEASSGISALKTALEAGNLAAAQEKLDSVQADLNQAMTTINEIPSKLPTEEYNQQMLGMANELLDWARSDGWKNLDKLGLPGEVPEGEEDKGKGPGGAGLDKPTAEDLSKNMKNVKSSLEFMQKAVDEMRFKPTVESTLVGGG